MARRGQRPTKGWVYVITNPAWPGYSKVGHTSDLGRRLSSYNTSAPLRDYLLETAFYTEDRFELEREIHSRMEGLRAQGEWFQIHPLDAERLLTDMYKDGWT